MNFTAQLALLPERLAAHLQLTLPALLAGAVLSAPLALLALRFPRLRWPLVTGAGVIQTIPSLALLALMVPVLAALKLPPFGYLPAALALVLYSLLPMVRGAVTGLTGVDATLLEAARALGLTPRQVLMKVRVPLALPVIFAGVRTSAVLTVGVATLSTPVGQTSLGNYLFAGLQTRNYAAVLVGCAAAAALAVLLDALLALLESGLTGRHRTRVVISLLALLSCGALAAAPLLREAPSRAPVRIGAKTFTEQYVLAQLLSRAVESAGFTAERVESLGSTVIFDALVNGELDVYVDYSGTLWSNVLRRQDTQPPAVVLAEVTSVLAAQHSVTCLGALGFENAYALAMPREKAAALGIAQLSQLSKLSPLRAAGDYEFFGRPEWTAVRDTYGLAAATTRSFDASLLYEAAARGEADVIAAFSSDGRIAAYDLVVLEDDLHALPPYDAVLLLGPHAEQHPGLEASLQQLLGRVPVELMREANRRVDEDGQSRKAAGDWLWQQVRGD